jgi:hypothetical protein
MGEHRVRDSSSALFIFLQTYYQLLWRTKSLHVVLTNSRRSGLPRKQPDVLKIETLHHADKAKADACILDLVVWLHCLISYSRPNCAAGRLPSRSPVRSPARSASLPRSPLSPPASGTTALTREDREMLQDVFARRQRAPGNKSKSQELSTCSSARLALRKNDRLSKSSNHSPSPRENGRGGFPLTTSGSSSSLGSPALSPVVDFDIDRIKALDVMDRVGVQKQVV